MMVAAVSATPNPKTSSREGSHQNPTRPPLIPSEADNGVALRRPKGREVTSRYLSSSTSTSTSSSTSSSSSSRRCASPLVSRTASSSSVMTPMPAPSSLIKRSQSVERRRPVTPRPNTVDFRPGNAGEVTTASKMLITSARSLSVSFQGESFSLRVSKTKPAPASVRKGTPERRKPTPTRADQTENSKPVDQHRWPGRSRQVNSLTRSMDCTDEKKKLGGSGIMARSLQQSMIDERNRTPLDGRLNLDSGNAELGKANELVNANSVVGSTVTSDPAASDTESVSSGSTSGAQESGGGGGGTQGRGVPRGIMVPARFWQETSNRLRRTPEPSSPQSKSNGLRTPAVPSKLIAPKKLLTDSPMSSPRGILPSRGQSPLRGPVRPASPSKLVTTSTYSPLRGMPSPTRVRAVVGSLNGNLSNNPSILSFAADVRRGKVGENRMVDAHLLRLLHNRYLQWRFINARADASLLVQRMNAEQSLCNARVAIVDLRDSVRDKRKMLQLMRQKLKLTTILKGQIMYLDEWGPMDRDHSNSLSGAIEALKASTLRLPVVSGARADIQNLKDAICSAVDVMQAMASSICSLLSKVEEVNSLVAELANTSAKERACLDQCRDLLSTLAAMQVTDCSLRTHILQLNRVPSSLTTKV